MNPWVVIEVEQENDICVLRLRGRVATGADDEYLKVKTQEIKNAGCHDLLLDIRELYSIGSSGIGFLVDLYTSWTRNAAGRMVLAGPMPQVMEALTLTRLTTILPIFPGLEAAFDFLKSGGKGIAASQQ